MGLADACYESGEQSTNLVCVCKRMCLQCLFACSVTVLDMLDSNHM